jgi:hypothetical protein
MRLLVLPFSMLLMLLTLGGCLAGGGHYQPSYGYGYGGYGHAPYGGYGYRPYGHGHRAWEPTRHHHHNSHARPIFPHRPIWKKW